MARTPVRIPVDVGDIELGVWRWPGEGAPFVFLHATGFHARCWDAVIEGLPTSLSNRPCYAFDLRFHGTSGKSGDVEWPIMANDVVKAIDTLDLHNVFLIGHSVGGYLSTVVAAESPQRVNNLLLIDPVIMAPERYAFSKHLRSTMRAEDNPIAKRRNAWDGPDEMYDRFKDRSPFDTWQDRILRDFCDHALVPGDAPRKLACDPMHEVQIYHHQNGDAITAAIPKVQQPVTILRAVEPTEADHPFDMTKSPTWPALFEQFENAVDAYHPELSHFIPMQAPELVISTIADMAAKPI